MTIDRMDNDIWMHKFKNGDESTLKDAFEFYGGPLFFYARNIVEDKEEAEDIVAESFIKLWRQRVTFVEQKNIKAYLYVITKNACLNYLKHKKRKASSHKEIMYLETEGHEEVMNRILHSELVKIVSDEIEKLPELAKKIFKLTFVEGLKPDEIALQLSMPTQNVRNNKSRALELLRNSLAKKDFMVSMVLLEIVCMAISQ
ncbi:MAG: RNA polymerase sigma-70 factor [Bacteroidetes bacterium]|nr:RNA polymerase sigma-70 factor [Bacteroidota bacterium]